MFLLLTIVFVGIFFGLVLYHYKKSYSFWKNKNVKDLPPSIPFGNFKSFMLQQKSIGEDILEIYKKLRTTNERYCGIYLVTTPILILLDPDLVKEVMVREFSHFLSRQRQENPNDPLSYHLVNVSGTQWKFLRTKLSPTFTSGKMKYMFNTMAECGKELKNMIGLHAEKGEPLEVKDILARFTTDIIASCAFGIDSNSLKNPDDEFRNQGKRIAQLSKWEQFKNVCIKFFPFVAKFLHLKRLTKETAAFFLNLVKTTVEFREKSGIQRNDFMDLLLQLKSKGYIEDDSTPNSENIMDTTKLSTEDIAAQCFLFFVAGFDTSSTTLYSAMYELANNQKVQNIARSEIRRILVKHHGEISYDSLMEMEYLEQIIEETLRLHPSVPFLTRRCTTDYTFSDGKLKIEKGTSLYISNKGFHTDSKYFPNPEIFDPERFSKEEKAKRHQYVYLPFGAGPRHCIGLRFAKLQMKLGLVALLKDHKFTLNYKTETPLKINPRNTLYNILDDIWLNVEKCP